MLQVEDTIEKQEDLGQHVAAIVVEPIQAEGGDNWASPSFFRQLQYICKKVIVAAAAFVNLQQLRKSLLHFIYASIFWKSYFAYSVCQKHSDSFLCILALL